MLPWKKQKQKQPLIEAMALIDQATEIAYTYLRDTHYQPAATDLALFHMLSEHMWSNHATLEHITHCMDMRFHGQPEGAKKFTDAQVFDYHHPP